MCLCLQDPKLKGVTFFQFIGGRTRGTCPPLKRLCRIVAPFKLLGMVTTVTAFAVSIH